ncbi:hypothetical protein BH23ACT11_BH23ACT11_26710 [soil metagenome]
MEIGEHKNSRRGTGGDLSKALWLARMDIRKSWISFPVATLTAIIPGLYLVVLYSGVFGGSAGYFERFLLDVWFLLMVTVLNVNFLFNRDYYYRFDADNYTKRLSFLRSLPITPRAVVGGRAMYMTVALICNAPSFFLVPYLADADLRSVIGPLDYMWFIGIWIGYALLMMGFLLFMWNGLSWEAEKWMIPIFYSGGCLGVAITSNLMLDDGLTMVLIRIAISQGLLAAATSLAVGCATLVLWTALAQKWLGKRELG